MLSKKKSKSTCSFASSKKPSMSKAFEFIQYIVLAGRNLKTKAKTNLQTQTHKSHGRTIVGGNRLQENLVKSVSCRFCHADVTLLGNVSASSRLGSSWVVSCENKHCPSRNSSENFLTNLVVRAAEFRSCKGYFVFKRKVSRRHSDINRVPPLKSERKRT